jgi:hypothetical protein
VHYQSVYEPQIWVFESLWNCSDNVEPQTAPKPDRAFVRADDTVKLHGAEASHRRESQRVLAHRRRNTSADRARRRHITAVSDMRAATPLVRVDQIGSRHQTLILCDKHLVILGKPV